MKIIYCLSFFIVSIANYAQVVNVTDKINLSETAVKQSMTEYDDYFIKRIEEGSFYYTPYTYGDMCRTIHYANSSNSNTIAFKINTYWNKCIAVIYVEDIANLPQLLKIFNDPANFTETDRMEYEDVDETLKIRIETSHDFVTVYVDALK